MHFRGGSRIREEVSCFCEGRRGFTLLKIISSYYWGVHSFEKGVKIFGKRGSRL